MRTDLHIYKWDNWAKRTINTPLIIGHEFCGIIDNIGPGVRKFKVGERVSGEDISLVIIVEIVAQAKNIYVPETIGIGVNRDGAFADYLVLPETNVWPIHNDISSDIASILTL